jgi:hypothetical protein
LQSLRYESKWSAIRALMPLTTILLVAFSCTCRLPYGEPSHSYTVVNATGQNLTVTAGGEFVAEVTPGVQITGYYMGGPHFTIEVKNGQGRVVYSKAFERLWSDNADGIITITTEQLK